MSDIDIKAKVSDAIKQSEEKCCPKFIGFFSPSERAEILPILKNVRHSFFGGYENSERVILCVMPDWMESASDYPIKALTFSFRRQDKLSHRDFLGSLMALGIKRSTVGDILVADGEACAFVLSEVAEYIMSQITKIGKIGVKITEGMPEVLPGMSGFIEGSGTVASLRLDCVVSALSGKSRNASADFISGGFVSLNSVAQEKLTQEVKSGDVIALRSIGKFIIVSGDERSKKGRVILKWKKYN